MRVALAAVALALGCGNAPVTTSPPERPTPPERPKPVVNAQPQARDDKPNPLAQRAEEALDSDTPLDYERPFVDQPRERDETRELFIEACNAGDRPSCWKAMYVARDQIDYHVFDMPTRDALARNCRGGDAWSCRALPGERAVGRWTFPGAPGEMGRSEACNEEPMASKCDLAELRRECDDEFAWSCWLLASSAAADAEADQLRARAEALALEDCRHDILKHCLGVFGPRTDMTTRWPEAARADALRRLCRFHRQYCDDIANNLEKQHGKPDEVRDLRELACQYTDYRIGCLRLAVGYLDGKYAEPVPGRGQRLLDHDCERTRKLFRYDRKQLEKYKPACKRASK
jgi:hypothetical protein